MKSIVFNLNVDKFELKNINESNSVFGDSDAYTCDVYLNGQYIGDAYNEGRGAEGYVRVSSNINTELKKKWKAFEEVVNQTTWKILDDVKELKYSMGFLVDCMVFNALVCNQSVYKEV